jgi:hypothetical protein
VATRLFALLRREHRGDCLELLLDQIAPGATLLAVLLGRLAEPLADLFLLIRGQRKLLRGIPEFFDQGIADRGILGLGHRSSGRIDGLKPILLQGLDCLLLVRREDSLDRREILLVQLAALVSQRLAPGVE